MWMRLCVPLVTKIPAGPTIGLGTYPRIPTRTNTTPNRMAADLAFMVVSPLLQGGFSVRLRASTGQGHGLWIRHAQRCTNPVFAVRHCSRQRHAVRGHCESAFK